MTVGGRASLDASREALLAVLRSPERLVAALPNVDEFSWETADGGGFSATIRPAIALGEVPFRTVWRPRRTEDGCVRYHVEGRSDEHWLELDFRLALEDSGGATEAEWSIDYRLTGAMRTAGQRTVSAVIAAQVELVLEAAAAQA
jgi:carbon monoxide dehydrogenase subunit G